jgi:myosin heavy subunit
MRKAREAAAEPSTQKVKVQAIRSSKYEVNIGGEKRVFSKHFLKRKGFLAALFLDSEEYQSYKKLIKQLEVVCRESVEEALPGGESGRREALEKIVEELRYEIHQHDVVKAWALLEADSFKHLEWFFGQTKDLHLVRPDFYDDLDKAYRDAKKLIKLLTQDVQDEFPPEVEKQDAYEDYLKDILEVYTHHHFVLKRYHQTRPAISLKDFELTKEEMQEKIEELRDESDELRRRINSLNVEKDQAQAEARSFKNNNDELKQKLDRLDPAEVQKQIRAAEAKANAAEKELQETLEEEAELRSDMRKLDEENQELTRKLQQLHAIPDESAYSVENLMVGKRVAIFGGVGRDHYWPILKEAGVDNEDYEWYEGYHTISQARTAEIVGRCDLVVVVTAYAGHLLLYQVRPCIQPHQHFFKIHKSGAGSLRKEILKTFKK